MEREEQLENLALSNEESTSGASIQDSKEEKVFTHICLPYTGNIKPRFIYKGKKIGSFFSVKDPIKKEHQTNLVYGYNNKDNPRVVQYIGETNVRFETRTHEHSHSDKHSSLYKHAIKHNYAVQKDDFKILETGYKNTLDRNLAEALYITELKPQLNEQVRCHNLKLFY